MRDDIDTATTQRTGATGLLEALLRRFRTTTTIALLLIMYAIAAAILGVAMVPGVLLVDAVWTASAGWPWPWPLVALALSLGALYFITGFAMIIVCPVANILVPSRIKPSRAINYSVQTVPWFFHNGITYLMRYTFLDMMTPTPFNTLFYRLMGMKIGRGAQINTTNISDPRLIQVDEKATIGGSATVIAHYGSSGFLIIARTRIRAGATVGLRAIVMGGVDIGEGAKILPNSVVMPKTQVPAGEIWGEAPR